ncbi:hypothetical protein JNJ66_05725 [Candidatus Saccharibacteria bacterium]|nr:hypothetical protein [Candidatus Saccharibacteria bacterium]
MSRAPSRGFTIPEVTTAGGEFALRMSPENFRHAHYCTSGSSFVLAGETTYCGTAGFGNGAAKACYVAN